MRWQSIFLILGAIIIAAAIGVFFLIRWDTARLPETATEGASPKLPPPLRS
jgi:hypothetical protein